jgi:RNA methyltransferase, TrmH family
MKRLTSRENPTYRQIASLRQGRPEKAGGLIFLEGLRLCADALKSGIVPVQALLADSADGSPACRELFAGLPELVERISMPDHLFNRLCGTDNPQGVALVCRAPLLGKPSAPPVEHGLYLVAEGIQDPGNLGTMIRTADAFAFDGILLTEGTVHPFNDKVLRAAMGSCFHIPLLLVPDISAAAGWLASSARPVTLLAADPVGADCLPGSLPVPAALVIGNEARGLSADARLYAGRLIRIPMPGRAESLNAAAAAAIVCYELMRSRAGLFQNSTDPLQGHSC